MKSLIFLLAISLSSCHMPVEDKKPYPGHQRSFEDCHESYDLGYHIDVDKCETYEDNPKYKRGQRVKNIKGYDKNCYAVVTRNSWDPVKNAPFFRANIDCGPIIFNDKEIEVK